MPQTPVDTGPAVGNMLKMGRRRKGLSQEAAAKLAGISETWWRRIENGAVPTATAGRLAWMFHAVGLSPEFLRSRGLGHVADLMADLQAMDLESPGQVADADALERYLMDAPADMETRVALVGFLRSLRTAQLDRSEPLQEQLWRTRRRLTQPTHGESRS